MPQYIDKSVILKEINRIIGSYDPKETTCRDVIINLRNFIYNLKVEDVKFPTTYKRKGGKITLLDLYKQIEYIGNQFTTWEIPMDKEIKLTLNKDNTIKVEIL